MINDPRVYRALKTLMEINRRYCILSTKGGVGKSTISTLLAVHSAKHGLRTGLLDLDFVNPSTHTLLGLNPQDIVYREEKGVEPYSPVSNLLYYTIVSYIKDNPIGLRGVNAKNALWETLSIVNWGNIEVLFIDTPPGIGDEHLELLGKLRDLVHPIIVSTPHKLSLDATRKLAKLLREEGYETIYLVENMGNGTLNAYARELGLTYLGYVPFIERIDMYTGEIRMLLSDEISKYIDPIVRQLLTLK